jgi:hypothetical protein
MEEFQKQHGQVHLQFSVLNLLDNLFSNLLPIPSMLNMILKFYANALKSNSGGGSRPRIMSNSILSSSAAQSEMAAIMSSNNQLHRESR